VVNLKSKLRKLRLIQFFLVGLVLVSASFAELRTAGALSQWNLLHWLMTGLAGVCLLEGLHLRHRLLRPSVGALARDIPNPKALGRWYAWQLMSLGMAAAVAMYGVVVRMVLAGAFWQALMFYSVSLFLLLVWTPRIPAAIASH
jgi:F0F1-type ATP synthase membrane subunit c/vacuolar-type H+-ATPase subunit K